MTGRLSDADFAAVHIFKVEAILAYGLRIGTIERAFSVGRLHAGRGELVGFANAGPIGGGLRRAPAEVAGRGRGERDSFIDADIGIGAGDAGELALFDADRVGDGGG